MNYSNYTKKVLARYCDGATVYRELISDNLAGVKAALHLGCGRDLGAMHTLFPANVGVLGLDPDANAVAEYPGEGHVGDGAAMPFENGSFDLVFSEYVLEHLDNPNAVFREVNRVLRTGGKFISVAPNFWSYKSLAAWATPHSFHTLAVGVLRRDHNREAEDVYPTVFRANTGRTLSELARNNNLRIENIHYVNNGPTWFQRIPILFELGVVYHAMLDLGLLKAARCNIVSVFVKE